MITIIGLFAAVIVAIGMYFLVNQAQAKKNQAKDDIAIRGKGVVSPSMSHTTPRPTDGEN
jgi:hypothetical protein